MVTGKILHLLEYSKRLVNYGKQTTLIIHLKPILMRGLIITTLFFISLSGKTQTPNPNPTISDFLRFRTVYSQVIKKDSRGMYESTGDWIKNSILITVDLKNLKVIMYANGAQEYSITEISRKEVDNKRDSWIVIKAVKSDGTSTIIRIKGGTDLQKEKNYSYLFTIYFDYDNISMVNRANLE
jgi:hypothetical protein